MQVLQEIVENGVKIYAFPDTEGDEEEAAANKKLRVSCFLSLSLSSLSLSLIAVLVELICLSPPVSRRRFRLLLLDRMLLLR